jgi:hypothetical protein
MGIAPRLSRLYHTTTVDRAQSIMIHGFRDNVTVNKRLFSGTTVYPPGVWFGNLPILDDELFDGVGLFDFDAEQQVFIAADLPLPTSGIESSTCDSTWPGIQYWGPASIWNRFPKKFLSLDEAIKLRFRDPKLRRNMSGWIEEYGEERGYNDAFVARVKRALASWALTRG